NLQAAQVIADRQYERRRLQSIIDRGPSSPLAITGYFGAGIMAFATDPIEVGVGVATGSIVTRVLGTIARSAGRGARVAASLSASTPKALLARSTIEGAIEGAVVEPLVRFSN